MLRHEQTQEQTAIPAAKVAVSAEELAEALSALESRRERSVPADSITIGEAVSELSLSYTPEELLAEIQARRQSTTVKRPRRRVLPSLLGAGVGLFVFVNVAWLAWGVGRAATAEAVGLMPPPQEATLAPPTPTFAPASDGDLQRLVTALEGQDFDAGRLTFLKAALRYNTYSSDQVRRILRTFDFDSDRIEAAVLLYPRVRNQDRFIWSLDVFEFDNGRRAVLERLRLN